MKNPKNIFVLCTGRCGSTTFARACGHFTNYTSGHETRTRALGSQRLAYPENHIEVDNRLAWLLGRLDQTYGDEPFFVHLKRDPNSVAKSYDKRWGISVGMILAYNNSLHMLKIRHPHAALDMVTTITANIDLFLKTKSNSMVIDIDNPIQGFTKFAQKVGAVGNLELALKEFSVRHNAHIDT